MNKILLCLDGSELSKDVCDYGVYLAKNLDLPLVLLNVVEHSHTTKKLDLSGNIGLGSTETILEELTNEEMHESKKLIAKGKETLKKYESYVIDQGITTVSTLQRHGALYETLEELSADLRIALIGLKGENNTSIGSHVEELLRTVNIPILLVNAPFKPIDSILMAYDGSDYAKKSIQIAAKNPIFPNTKRYLVNVNKDETIAKILLLEAKMALEYTNLELETHHLNGEPVESLLNFQEANDIDIIAMGAYSHNRFRSAIFGSFTTKMLLNTKKPLVFFR